MFRRPPLYLAGIVLLLYLTVLLAQNPASNHQQRLRQIRAEIDRMEKKIAVTAKKEASELYRLRNLDLDIDIAHSVILDLKKQQAKREREITSLEKSIIANQEKLTRLKEVFSKRLVYVYKYGRMKDIELLLTARSINDGLLWLEYQKRLSEHDYRNFQRIGEQQARITGDKDLLTIEVENKRQALANKLAEEAKLKATKQERRKLLLAIRQDKSTFAEQLSDWEIAEKEIENLITQLEASSRDEPEMPAPDVTFAELRGRMTWPAQGEVITKFGRYRHPELRTVTESIGIEIRARIGAPVVAVASGQVTAITWQRGRGNIVIARHYGGYYSVYTHLEDVMVNEGDQVSMGEKLGTVGESGSLKGPVLHFEIWKGTEKLNPELWLAKST
jgi:septal ring factor EnvC (AmiA/AmiB activator)